MNVLLLKQAIILTIALIARQIFTFKCNLPDGCFLQPIKYSLSLYNYEKSPYRKDSREIKCKTDKSFQFNFTINDFMSNESNETCIISEKANLEKIVFEWPKTKELIILDKNFQVSNMVEYFRYFESYFDVNLVNLKGIDINLRSNNTENTGISVIRCIGCTMNFYTNGKLIKSCQDILESNSTVSSIFQIKLENVKQFGLINNNYPMDLCPLIFKNADIEHLTLMELVDSFYKKSLVKFTDNDFNDRNGPMANNIKKIIESKTYKERSKCNFEHRLDLCNKTNYKIEDIWSTIDYYYLNNKLQSAFKISSYLISLFGIASNLMTVIMIVIKSNSDLFKEFNQYSYLAINSVFCIVILAINILSWTTECFYPFEAFCPEIRKILFFQFFKIIFKECLTTTFRFMLNFSYVAFALNRIAIIKKDQNKFLKFITEMSIWIYIGVTLLISSVLSVIKYFKYEVNNDYPWMNYPISNEWDISSFHLEKKGYLTFDYVYFIMNSISDIFNYVIFVLICIFIDIYMVRELRQIMADKLQKIERLYADSKTKIESAKKETDEAMNKAIRMVVINTAIGILFKMPVSFIPILNVYATFYYTSFKRLNYHLAFGRFYRSLFLEGFYSQISDLADFLFLLSISIQPLIYKHFDKKFQIAFDRFFNKNQQHPNSSNSSKTTTK